MSVVENLNAVATFFHRQGCEVVAQRFAYLAECERIDAMAAAAAKLPRMTDEEVRQQLGRIKRPFTITRIKP